MAFFGLFGKEKKETLDKGLEKSKESVLSKNRACYCRQEYRGR